MNKQIPDIKHKKTLKVEESKVLLGLCSFFLGMCVIISLISYNVYIPEANKIGLFGNIIAFLCFRFFGLSSFLLPVFCFVIGFYAFKPTSKKNLTQMIVSGVLIILSSSLLLTMMSTRHIHMASFFERWLHANKQISTYHNEFYYLGGTIMHELYFEAKYSLKKLIGSYGSILLCFSCLTYSLFIVANINVATIATITAKFLAKTTVNVCAKIKSHKKAYFKKITENKKPFTGNFYSYLDAEPVPPQNLQQSEETTNRQYNINPKHEKLICNIPDAVDLPSTSKEYKLPSSALLTKISLEDPSLAKQDMNKQAALLEETLLNFGIEAKVGDIHCGPTIATFEVLPSVGVKVQKIKALENDIALNMQAKSIRIIAPIPGKAAVGIEIPSPRPQEVSFRNLLEEYRASNKSANIPLLLGKTSHGDNLWADLAKMPHLIIAGATGAGKSVCINAIVMSIVMNASPDEIKLVMVDPKKVELTGYSNLPHMLAPVITDPSSAHSALCWLVKEMENRYEILKHLGIRNIQSFNARNIDLEMEQSMDIEIPKKLPFITVIIDELADLMLSSSQDVETPIARIAQMARAVGIHMILATQRPSREVITGLIKANFPCRIAFKVASRINSQIIIDDLGAESLLGNGDMLFLPPGASGVIRAQGVFIRDEDINTVTSCICAGKPPKYIIPSFDTFREESSLTGLEHSLDPLLDDAKNIVLGTGNASTTFLQRKLKIGYARAASLMDALEEIGIIGPSEGAKPRKIFYPKQSAHSKETN